MNIFVLHIDPMECAQYHNDVHINKMLLESCQLLCSVHHHIGSANIPYKATHINHPCSIWVRKSLSNYRWLLQLSIELEKERLYRGFKPSKCMEVVNWCSNNIPGINDIGLTEFAVATTGMDSTGIDPVEAYRRYYITHKQGMYIKQRKLSNDNRTISKFKPYTWTNRGTPNWFEVNKNIRKYIVSYEK